MSEYHRIARNTLQEATNWYLADRPDLAEVATAEAKELMRRAEAERQSSKEKEMECAA